MGRKRIERNLKKALLKNGPMVRALFEFELEEHIDEYMQSKRDDGDEYFFAVTEHTDHVAMLLIDDQDNLHINEAAHAVLQEFWGDVYWENMKLLIPGMAEELDRGFLWITGVKVVDEW